MMKAPAPMTGGIICPPLLAAASAAPAMWGLSPMRFISGIVNVPVVTTLPEALPDTVPMSALDPTAARPAPARILPNNPRAKFTKNRPAPDSCKNAPRIRNMMMNVAEMTTRKPSTPPMKSVESFACNSSQVWPPCPKGGANRLPHIP